MDLELQTEISIFESLLTTFKASSIYWGSCGGIENWLKSKTRFNQVKLVQISEII